MTGSHKFLLFAAACFGVISLLGAAPAAAFDDFFSTFDDPSEQVIIRGLTAQRPRHMTARDFEKEMVAERILNEISRSGALEPDVLRRIRRRLDLHWTPSIDIAVFFDLGSAEITSRASRTLDTLGRALRSSTLNGSTIILAGHTDCTGRADFNLDLSRRRARSVSDYIVREHRVPRRFLVDVGFGQSFPKDTRNCSAAVNRRVQIINLGA